MVKWLPKVTKCGSESVIDGLIKPPFVDGIVGGAMRDFLAQADIGSRLLS